MATGRLGNLSPVGSFGGSTPAYTVPTGYYTVANISFTNTNSTSVTIRLAMATTTSPQSQEYIEYGTTIVANGVFERTGLVMQAGMNLMAYCSGTGVNVTVYGIETSTT
jgi:hypothetical protein